MRGEQREVKRVYWLCVLFSGLVLSCGSSSKETLYLFNWSYYIPDEVLNNFRQETGIKVVLDTYDSNESMYAKLRSGNAHYDIVVPSADYLELMLAQNMLATLNHEWLPNLHYLDDNLEPLFRFDAQQKYGVPYFAAGINVNVSRTGELPASWAIFGEEKLSGRMTMMNDMRETLGAALAYLGYSVNSTNEAEILAARDWIVEHWKPNLMKFDAEMFGKDFASGAATVAHGYAEVVLTELEDADGVEHQYLLPIEGGLIYVDSLVILASSPNYELAHQFINYLLRPDVHALIADTFYYPHLMAEASAYRMRSAAYTLEQLVALGYEVKRDVGSATSVYSDAWSDVLKG
jgi:spermidine/putrescine transport system substrate-binding protein